MVVGETQVRCVVAPHQDLEVRFGPAQAGITLRVSNCTMRRQGYHLFWHMSTLYTGLNMEQFSGRRHMWLNHQWRKWENFMARLGFSASKHFLVPPADGDFSGQPPVESSDCRVASTLGLCALLSQWNWAPDSRGGVRDARLRSASEELLEALIAYACSGGAFGLDLATAVNELSPWPKPFVARGGADVIRLEVSATGFVCLRPLIPDDERAPSAMSQRLLCDLEAAGRNGDAICWRMFLKALWRRCGQASLWQQALVQVSLRADFVLSAGRPPLPIASLARSVWSSARLACIGPSASTSGWAGQRPRHQWPSDRSSAS